MTHPQRHNRPRYCPDYLIDDYVELLQNGGDYRMLKTLKVLRSIIVNAGIISIALVSIFYANANPTMVSLFSIATLGLYNGVEIADYRALAQGFQEAKAQQDDADSP